VDTHDEAAFAENRDRAPHGHVGDAKLLGQVAFARQLAGIPTFIAVSSFISALRRSAASRLNCSVVTSPWTNSQPRPRHAGQTLESTPGTAIAATIRHSPRRSHPTQTYLLDIPRSRTPPAWKAADYGLLNSSATSTEDGMADLGGFPPPTVIVLAGDLFAIPREAADTVIAIAAELARLVAVPSVSKRVARRGRGGLRCGSR
jgi:hypothetical protein